MEQQFLKVRDRSIVFIPKLYLPYSRLQINFLTAWRNSTIIFCPKMYKHPSFKFSNEFKVSMFISYRKFPINPFDPRSKNFWSTFLKTSCIYYCPEKEENQVSLLLFTVQSLEREKKHPIPLDRHRYRVMSERAAYSTINPWNRVVTQTGRVRINLVGAHTASLSMPRTLGSQSFVDRPRYQSGVFASIHDSVGHVIFRRIAKQNGGCKRSVSIEINGGSLSVLFHVRA